MVLTMDPCPATSTTFSCQLSRTLIAAPIDSFAACGLDPTWLKPVCWGVILVGVRGALPPDDDAVEAMPLYLSNQSVPNVRLLLSRFFSHVRNIQVFHQDIEQFASAGRPIDALQHGRHLARLDRLQDLDDSLQMRIL